MRDCGEFVDYGGKCAWACGMSLDLLVEILTLIGCWERCPPILEVVIFSFGKSAFVDEAEAIVF
jgi:hypothetical protein